MAHSVGLFNFNDGFAPLSYNKKDPRSVDHQFYDGHNDHHHHHHCKPCNNRAPEIKPKVTANSTNLNLGAVRVENGKIIIGDVSVNNVDNTDQIEGEVMKIKNMYDERLKREIERITAAACKNTTGYSSAAIGLAVLVALFLTFVVSLVFYLIFKYM